VRGLEAAGVGATIKHFPGLGRVRRDTHIVSADLDTPVDELDASDWRPFKDVLAGTSAQLMVGHVSLTAVDPGRPASHSKAVIDGIIRKKWHYQGIIITDDLVMRASISCWSPSTATSSILSSPAHRRRPRKASSMPTCCVRARRGSTGPFRNRRGLLRRPRPPTRRQLASEPRHHLSGLGRRMIPNSPVRRSSRRRRIASICHHNYERTEAEPMTSTANRGSRSSRGSDLRRLTRPWCYVL
jgi:hypothetical protein